MKSLINSFLCLSIPFVLWFFCFHHFFTGHLLLQADAISYSDHISFYTDNLSKGIFPLWNHGWYGGAPYHFFLRRIGDVNPLLWGIVLLKWVGVPSATAYLVFLAMYYFLAGWAFYLIARFLFVDRFSAFTAYILLLFSSWGSEIFYNYIIIIFVPIIWFFYFLLCFARTPKKGYFLGMCLCVGLIVTTYIPFFFLTILILFTFLYVLFYGRSFRDFLKRSWAFFYNNKMFTCFCVIFILVSCVPALVFYKESKSGEFVLPNRHAGTDVSSAVAVGLDNVASGDIISHGYFDRIFDDQAHIDMGDIFIPYIFFLCLLSATVARVNKLIFFLLFNILALSLITITSAAGVHQFLYDHILIFKFIRNIYYFFWLAMLPMGILLAVAAFKSLLAVISDTPKKKAWLMYIIGCHLVFVLFLLKQEGVLWGAWVAIFISLVYFWIYLTYDRKISYPAGFCLFLLAVFIQSVQVYGFLEDKLFQTRRDEIHFEQMHKNPKAERPGLYYASHWFAVIANYIDPSVLNNYLTHPFVLYDNVLPYVDTPEFFKTMQDSMATSANIAYVSKFDSEPGDWRNNPYTKAQAQENPVSTGQVSVVRSDANGWVIKTHLRDSQFLVINDNYNSGWHAFINSHPARLLRANISFKGVWVPAGESTVLLRFSNPMRYALHILLVIFFMGTFLYLCVLLKTAQTDKHE